MKEDMIRDFCQKLSTSVGCALIYQRATKRKEEKNINVSQKKSNIMVLFSSKWCTYMKIL